eukprot:658992-Pelagomonas_calceolata.AAC.1
MQACMEPVEITLSTVKHGKAQRGKGTEKTTLGQRAVSLPHQRVKGKLMWAWWVPGLWATTNKIDGMQHAQVRMRLRKQQSGSITSSKMGRHKRSP